MAAQSGRPGLRVLSGIETVIFTALQKGPGQRRQWTVAHNEGKATGRLNGWAQLDDE